ncbi:MAG: CYTH domain-containing protein [Clostridia bacterium]|nr:CYTH domain-containing protein [Clostridia bacterium]
MRETEITVQIYNELAEIDEILRAQGFEMIGQYQMRDHYFTRITDAANTDYVTLMKYSFLLRETEGKVKLCYKNKETDEYGNVISEEKTECVVSDPEKAIAIFRAAGLKDYCVVENESYIYKKGEVSFAIQVIKDLGTFLECEENEGMRDLTVHEKLARLTETVRGLGLHLGEDYSCKKVYMLLKKKA